MSIAPRWLPIVQSTLRGLMIGVAACVAVAALLSLMTRGSFANMLVFSLCIGLSCQCLIDGGRHVAARIVHRSAAPGAPPQRWPGWRWMGPIIAVGTWAGIQVGYPLAGWLLGHSIRAPGLDQPRTLLTVLVVSLSVALGFTIVSLSKARLAASEARAQRAQRAAAENQLKLLESQLEPHMLFNTLANLRVLIGSDPARAQAMLDRLIAFLRATLNASRSDSHTLAAEFDRLADYLALMQIRMGARLVFAFALPPELRALPVPPLLLQPLVENSIHHGLEPSVAGGRIDVTAAREDDRLVLTVRDSGVGLSPPGGASSGTRFGLQQVRERLQALHGPAAHLSLGPAPDGGALARVELPWPATPPT